MTAPSECTDTPAAAVARSRDTTARRTLRLGIASALLTVLIWTTWVISTRFAMHGNQPLPASLLAFIRFGTAALVLAPAWWRFRAVPRTAPPLALLGLMSAGLPYQFLVLWGLHYAPASEAGPLLAGSLPLFIAVISALVLGERIGPWRIVGVLLISGGVVAITGNGLMDLAGGAWRGHLAILGASLAWSIYTVSFRASGLSGIQAAAFVGLWSVVLLLPFAGHEIWQALQVTPLPALGRQVLVQGVLAGVVALITYTTAVRCLGPARATAITSLTPPAAVLGSMLLLDEAPGLMELLGCGLIVIGVLAVSGLSARRKPQP
ncbi:DMT family transporter [Azorhizobium sp. AG788]|uniref:DMT family transporter n=1 Tax=Azorhizobium sp. AG788 TaxID=2183897 RepID=UPI00313A023D